MVQSPRGGRWTGLSVLGAVALLLVVGRLMQPALDKPSPTTVSQPPPPTGLTAPPTPVLELAQPITGLAVTAGGVWVAHGTTILRLDPRSLLATATLVVSSVATDITPDIERPIRGLTSGDGAIWAALPSRRAGLLRIDPMTGRIVAALGVVTVAPVAIDQHASRPAVWLVCCGGETYLGAGRLVRVDPRTNHVVASIPLPGLADAVGAGPSGVWVRAAAGPVWRVDPETNRVVATLAVLPHGLGGTPGSVAVGRDAVWVSDPATASVIRIDPASNRVTGRVDAAGQPLAVAGDGTVLGTSGTRLLGLGRGPVRSASVNGLSGNFATNLAPGAGPQDRSVWIAQSGALLHVDVRLLP